MKYLIILLIVSLAAIANSAMDEIDFRASESIFTLISNDSIKAWILENGVFEAGWMSPFFTFCADGFHFAKSVMVGLFIGSISYFAANNWFKRTVLFLVCSLVWMGTHMIFFKEILSIK